jgi:hypothetical protein
LDLLQIVGDFCVLGFLGYYLGTDSRDIFVWFWVVFMFFRFFGNYNLILGVIFIILVEWKYGNIDGIEIVFRGGFRKSTTNFIITCQSTKQN